MRLFTLKFVPMKVLKEIPEIEITAPSTPAKAAKGTCSGDHKRLLGMRDAMEVLSGKWKIQIIGTLLFEGKMRFMDLRREVDGIAAKMLSKELQDLEAHALVKRTVMGTKPITVEYEITPHGRSLEKVVVEIVSWGQLHRERIMKVS
jgi:DNA-binding HxlR family transcriptional regulator